MTGFIRRKVTSLTLGEKLRKIREKKGLSLEEVSAVTRIQVKYLKCLEESNFSGLPADVYVKGFLKGYARYLDIDDQLLIKLYQREKEIYNNIEEKENKSTKPQNKPPKPIAVSKFIFTPKAIWISLVIVSILASVFYLYREINNFILTPYLVIESPATGTEIGERSVEVAGLAEKDAQVFINGQPTLLNAEGKFSEVLDLQLGLNQISVKAINRFEKEVIKTVAIKAVFEEEIKVPEEEPVEIEEPQNLRLELVTKITPVWVSVETDEKLAYSGVLNPDELQLFSAQNKIVITSEEGSKTFFKLNGGEEESLSLKPGFVRDRKFVHEIEEGEID